ncbi:MAG: tyrosine-type recombinase/integrase [Clostridiales bacterium]|jgi:site-specific recombinase XerD|nr:tyrosine-type recombinase/integrase [Clostridiales bacterium]
MAVLCGTAARIDEALPQAAGDASRDLSEIRALSKGGVRRSLPLAPLSKGHLGKYLGIYRPNALHAPGDPLSYSMINCARKSLPPDWIRKKVKACVRSAKQRHPEVPDNVHPHTPRHSRAMHLLEKNAPLEAISQLLGHKSISTTQDLRQGKHGAETYMEEAAKGGGVAEPPAPASSADILAA